MQERTDPDCIPLPSAVAALESAPWRNLVGVGDSIVAGIREPLDGYADRSATQRLTAAFERAHPDARSVNLAERDLRLSQIIDRQLAAALRLRPDLVLISAGGNDALRRSFRPDAIRSDLLQLAQPLADSGALIVTMGLFDIWRSGLIGGPVARTMAGRFDALDSLTAEVTGALGGVHVELHHHPRARDVGIFSTDLMHCNARGHAIAATATINALGTYQRPPGKPEEPWDRDEVRFPPDVAARVRQSGT